MTIPAKVEAFLADKGTPYDLVFHPKTYSSSETASAAHLPEDHIAKGVVLKDAQGYLLVVIPASEWINLNHVRDELNRDLHLAPEEEMERLFPDCEPGAVPPLGEAYEIETILDEALTSLAKVYLEAGDHKQLISVTNEHFAFLMKGIRHGHFSQIE